MTDRKEKWQEFLISCGERVNEYAKNATKIFDLMRWEWVSVGVPNYEQIYDAVMEKLKRCLKECETDYIETGEAYFCVASGRIRASIRTEDEYPELDLFLEIE